MCAKAIEKIEFLGECRIWFSFRRLWISFLQLWFSFRRSFEKASPGFALLPARGPAPTQLESPVSTPAFSTLAARSRATSIMSGPSSGRR